MSIFLILVTRRLFENVTGAEMTISLLVGLVTNSHNHDNCFLVSGNFTVLRGTTGNALLCVVPSRWNSVLFGFCSVQSGSTMFPSLCG